MCISAMTPGHASDSKAKIHGTACEITSLSASCRGEQEHEHGHQGASRKDKIATNSNPMKAVSTPHLDVVEKRAVVYTGPHGLLRRVVLPMKHHR